MQSDALTYGFGRWGLFFIGCILVLAGLGTALQEYPFNVVFTLSFIGLFLFAFGYFVHDRVALVEMTPEAMHVRQAGRTRTHAWSNVGEVQLVDQMSPPCYRITFLDSTPTAYCTVRQGWAALSFFGMQRVFDYSGFGDYAKKHMLLGAIAQEEERMAQRTMTPPLQDGPSPSGAET